MKARIALLLFASIAQCLAADPLSTLAELRAALREELKSALDKGNIENNQRLYQLESLLIESLPDKELPDEKMAQVIQTLMQIRTLSREKKVTELADSLRNELRAQTKDAAKRLKEFVNGAIAKCLREGLKATKPEELDAPLKELSDSHKHAQALWSNARMETSLNGYSLDGYSSAERMLHNLQNLFLAEERGDKSGKAQMVADMRPDNFLVDVIPRSELTALVDAGVAKLKARGVVALSEKEFDQKLQEAIDAVTDVENLGSALKHLMNVIVAQEKTQAFPLSSGVPPIIKKIVKIHDDVTAGLGTTVDVSLLVQREEEDRTSKIKTLLLRFLMPRILGIDEGSGMKANEPLPHFLTRTALSAMEKRDWSVLSRILDFSGRLPASQSPLNTLDSSAFKQFLSALNLEGARQYSSAVASYHAALKTGSQNLPLDFIGDRLAEIEKEHAKEYQAGVELSNTPVIERYLPGSRTVIFPPGYPGSRMETSPPIQLLPPASSTKPAKLPESGSAPRTEPKSPAANPAEPPPTEKKGGSDKQ